MCGNKLRTLFMARGPARVRRKQSLVRFCRSGRGDDVCADLPCHILQRCELLLIDQIELRHEVVEVFVAGVDVGLGPDAHDSVKVVNVDVDKHAVQPGQNLLTLRLESLRKWNVRRHRKQLQDIGEITTYVRK